jgi:hypothetical protein
VLVLTVQQALRLQEEAEVQVVPPAQLMELHRAVAVHMVVAVAPELTKQALAAQEDRVLCELYGAMLVLIQALE